MPIDYSKWKDIEISDDEDDTHPNIDTPSLFKWRNEARLQRMKEFEERKGKAEKAKKECDINYKKLQEKLATTSSETELSELRTSIQEIEEKRADARKKLDSVAKEAELRPWNVDTISKEGFSKTKINKAISGTSAEDLSEEEKEKRMKAFVEENKSDLNSFGWLNKFDDSKAFLLERTHLACEESANYLVIQCLNLAMEEKFGAMEQVAHQCICMQYLLELAKQLDVDPRSCTSSFFTKIQVADPEYKKAFDDELVAFKDRIRIRAKEKIQEQLEEEERLEREARLGPGGLDPIEVLESLPEKLKDCFESQDVTSLQKVIGEMDPAEARLHMKRCVDSGLWKPAEDDPNTNPEDGFRVASKEEGGSGEDADEESKGEVYEEVVDAKAKTGEN